MEHVIRIAFCIVAVALTLSGCQPISIIESNSSINLLRDEVKCPEDGSEYYTPDRKNGCILNALECFRLELGTVQEECEDPSERIDDTLAMMNNTINNLKVKDKTLRDSAGCKSCEEWDKKPFGKFLDECTVFLQMVQTELHN